jgi:hypothetical protein
MSTPAGILNKVKFLRNLQNSPNLNESQAAKSAADKLIAKFQISEAELEAMDPKPLYGEDQLLYHTFSIVSWMDRLALAVAKHFDCYLVQETLSSSTGEAQYNYFVYGGPEEESCVKFAFPGFLKQIYHLLDTKCLDRGPIYQNSYAEGVTDAIKQNIELFGIDIPASKKLARPLSKQMESDTSHQALTTSTKKEAPVENRVDVRGQSLIKDIQAYFRGMADGQGLGLSDVLELEFDDQIDHVLLEMEKLLR